MKSVVPKSLLTSLFEGEEEYPTLEKGGVGGFVRMSNKRYFRDNDGNETFLLRWVLMMQLILLG
jgi:hypothetical protein